MQITQALSYAINALNINAPKQKIAYKILSKILNQPLTYLLTHQDLELSHTQQDAFLNYIDKLNTHYPLEYLLGEVEFYGEVFFTDPKVLIARPETELVIDHTLAIHAKDPLSHIVEIGTGSGIIPITLAKHIHTKATVTDINPKAITLTQNNASHHGVSEYISAHNTSLLKGITCPNQILISNPPYIAKDYNLDPTVSFEPGEALVGGPQGHELLMEIVDLAFERHFKWLICEMGFDQKAPLTQHISKYNSKHLEFYKDLAGLDRGFILQLRS